jgi:HAE1 family hydrophobic/amphiphilic exporter-1
MNPIRFSVRRPIFTTMVTLIVITVGAVSLSKLRIDMLPAIEMPRLTVRTGYEGASPEVMERLVTQPVEEIIATVPGVEEMTSISSEGRSTVRVTFAWGTDIDVAALDLRSRLEDELNELPEEVERPQIRKFDIASFPVVILGIGSKLDPVELTTLIEDQVRYRFARIPGVAQVDMWGEYKREVRVALDIDRVRALELPLSDILQSIRNSNIDMPAGDIRDGRYEVTLRAPAEFQTTEEIGKTVVAVREGAPIKLEDIARVIDTHERRTRIVRVNGELGLRIAIRKQAEANTVEVAQRVLAEIERVNRDFPQIHVVAVVNQGNFIERSISNVANSVMYGGILAILVLLFFLRSVRSTLVISASIPISIIATFALIYFGGLTLNLMTLGGLALGVGMMVDSSIVVLENIFRRREELGEPADVAAVEGASEVAGAIIASTITTVIIFLPLLFLSGVSGLLFRELAYVVAFSLMCSLIVALTLVPMLAARLMREPGQRAPGRPLPWWTRLGERANKAMNALSGAYRNLLRRALHARLLTILVAAGVTGASLLLFPLIGSEFMPPSDEGEVRVSGEMEIGTRLELIDGQSRQIEAIVDEAVPEALASVVSIGSSGYRPDSGGRTSIRLSLVPADQRSRSNRAIAADLRRRLAGKVAGMKIRTRAPQGQFILQRILGGEEDGITVDVRGFDLTKLTELAARAAAAIEKVPGITDVDISRKKGVPQAVLRMNRAKISQLGLSVRDVAEILDIAVAGRRAGEFRPFGKSYRILVQLENARDLPLEEILGLTLRTPTGSTVTIRDLVDVDRNRGPVVIDRKDQQRLVSISANIAGRDMGSVAADVERALESIPKPVGYEMSIEGTFAEQEKASHDLLISLLLALALVYMVLACQYESLRDPLVVMFSVPVAATGVLLTLWLTGTTLNVQSYIGCIMLGGIVVNNAILLVDQAGQLRVREGMSTEEAVAEAGRRRLRPILMTTTTTILGLLPLALGIGEGAEAQAPLARAVIGGLLGSTLITLVLIPVVYSLFHREAQ